MSVDVGPTGIWHCEKDAHSFDTALAQAIGDFLLMECDSIADIGCGSGDYSDYLGTLCFNVIAIDGNPKTKEFYKNADVLDLSVPIPVEQGGILPVPRCNWGLCLEVGEHIPQASEQTFIDNVCLLSERGVILSWFPRDGEGIGHVNPRPNEYVKEQFSKRGFFSDEDGQKELRAAATLWWFKESLMVFRRL